MDNTRRSFMQTAAAILAASPWLASSAATQATDTASHDMAGIPPHWMAENQIAMLLYPGFTALDLVGPQYMLAGMMGAKVHLVASSLSPVASDTGITVLPTMTLADCPRDLDLLFIPGGGLGTLEAMRNESLVKFVADRGSRAKWVTSVCTGSLVLATAGLLKGHKATSHWIARDLLALAGATPVDARVVRDQNRITGAGVSAGLDLGLTLVELMRDKLYAQSMQLLAEYAPEPPFNAGTPRTAPPEATAMLVDMFKGFSAGAKQTLLKS